jgi:hypothetical protein
MTMRRPKITKKDIHIHDIDFRYCVDVDYESDYSGCTCEDYCRCGRIVNTRVNDLDCSKVNYISERILKETDLHLDDKDLALFIVQRLAVCNKIYSGGIWEVSICGGYYGQEIGDVNIDISTSHKLEGEIKECFALKTITEQMLFLLKKEYGYVLPVLEDKEAAIKKVALKNVVLGNDEYYRKLGDSNLYARYKGICGVVIAINKKYRLIDGYHRINSAKQENLRSVDLIVFE